MKTSGILLDSDVLAEIRKATPDPRVVAFLRRRAWRHMYISVLSVGELKGLYPYPETDRWIAELLERFADHVITIDAKVSLEWAGRNAPIGNGGEQCRPAGQGAGAGQDELADGGTAHGLDSGDDT